MFPRSPRRLFLRSLLSMGICLSAASNAVGSGDGSISSRVLEAEAGEQVVIQEIQVHAPLAAVWAAFSTSEGWTGWAVPVAEVDLKAGGTIRTHYDPDAAIGDPATNLLHIVNYVPERVLTLRAELAKNWPEVMKQDAGNLMNVIVFEKINHEQTRVISYGVGYRKTEEYDQLMKFFIPANEGLYRKLQAYLEDGERATFPKH